MFVADRFACSIVLDSVSSFTVCAAYSPTVVNAARSGNSKTRTRTVSGLDGFVVAANAIEVVFHSNRVGSY